MKFSGFFVGLNSHLQDIFPSQCSSEEFDGALESFLRSHEDEIMKNSSPNVEGLFEAEGVVADIFDPEVELVRMGTQWSVFSNPETVAGAQTIPCDESPSLRDVQVFLISIKDSGSEKVWKDLATNSGFENKLEGLPIVVKTFASSEKIKLGSILKVRGILSLASEMETSPSEFTEYHDYYKAGLVPHLFALEITPSKDVTMDVEGNLNFSAIAAFKEAFIKHFNDPFAADLLLASLISTSGKKYMEDNIDFLGLNLYNCSSSLAEGIYKFLTQSGFPFEFLNITKDSLKNQFLAYRDTNYGVFRFGKVHPATKSPILISEVDLQPGKFDEVSSQNLARLQQLVQTQKLLIEFPGGTLLPYELNIPMISLSTSRSIFPFQIKLAMDSSNSSETKIENLENLIDPKQLQRDLQTARKRMATIQLNENMVIFAQADFVEIRKNDENRDKFTAEWFTLVIKLSKHLAVISGHETVLTDHYENAKKIVLEIMNREGKFLQTSSQNSKTK